MAATPLMVAARRGHESVCRLLLDKGAKIDAAVGTTGWTPLMFAVRTPALPPPALRA